jgi:DNA polymerase III subunit delta
MQTRASAAEALIAKSNPKPIYLFHGEETLLQIEAIDQLREKLRSLGYQEREVWTIERGFKWSEAQSGAASGSLFSSQKMVEIRVPTGKLGLGGDEQMLLTLKTANLDTVMIVSMAKLEKGQLNSAWYRLADEQGLVVDCTLVEREQLGEWLRNRLSKQKQKIDPDALQFLVDASEGNLLAAKQAVDALAHTGYVDLNLSVVEDTISFAARYATAGLSEAFLANDKARTITVLRGLRAEAEAVPKVVWQLASDVHLIAKVVSLQRTGLPVAQAIKQAFVWGRRQQALQVGLNNGVSKQVAQWLGGLHELDAASKGLRPKLDVWDAMERFVLGA